MTRSQRAQVVELLRCSHDAWIRWGEGIGTANEFIGAHGAWVHAVDAWYAAEADRLPGMDYGDISLEAAARVELGEWP